MAILWPGTQGTHKSVPRGRQDEVLIAGELQESSKKLITRIVTEQDTLVEQIKLGNVDGEEAR